MHEQLSFITGEVRSALRFRWIGLGAAWLVGLGGWLYIATMPDVYEARASFFLDTSSLLAPVLDDQIIATDPAAQLAYIRAALLGDTTLQAVASTVGLDVGLDDNPLAYEGMLTRLREGIRFDSAAPAANQRPGTQSFTYNLSFRHTNRDRSIAVVRALVNSFIEGAMGEARRDEDDALTRLEQFIEEREEDLRRQEREIADFKRANADSQPGAQGEYLERLQSEKDDLAAARRTLSGLEARRAAQLERMEQQRQVVLSSPGVQPANSLPARIAEAERILDQLKRRFQDTHREVVAQQSIVDDLKAQRAEEMAALGLDDSDLMQLELEASPVYQAAQIALNEVELAIAELQTEIVERAANVTHLESLIDESLDNETQLDELERTYQVDYDAYLDLVRSRNSLTLTMQASAAEQLDFRSIDDPNASLTPVEPNRLLLILGVFVAALGAGGALCYGLAQLRPVFGNARSLKSFAQLPVLGTVTNAWPEAQRAAFRRSVWSYAAAFALLFLVFVGVVGIELVGPGIHAPFRGG